ncbi:MAG: nucleotidyltransferase [Chthoniobacterales bacterium]
MADGPYDPETGELIPRDPSLEDVVALCRELNARGAVYLVVGGFAVRAAGYARHTGDVDLVVDAGLENEAKVFDALATLPDKAVRELEPGDLAKYVVVRVADEILVDLMASASGIDYAEAVKSVNVRVVDGVAIPFASPELLWRMKSRTHREKDRGDLQFLRMWFEARGVTPPGE